MSNLDRHPAEAVCGGGLDVAAEPVRELLPARDVVLGGPRGTLVRRTLPHRDLRMVGAWCFADHYGPDDIAGRAGMRVPPHPHTGLQTVSWLVEGEVLHKDSLGNTQPIRPGQLNLMTAGRGIAHSEESPAGHPPVLHGVQLWVALPGADRDAPPDFAHHPDLPIVTGTAVGRGVAVTVLMGDLDGARSPARAYSPLVAADLDLEAGAAGRLPLRPDFEYAALGLTGDAEVDGVPLGPGPLLYLGTGRSDLTVAADRPSRVLVLGGEPFEERIVMWWNLVGRDHDEVVRAREDWMAGRRFGTVRGYDGDPLPAPALPTTRLKPRGRRR
ncbi:MAG TPA: pirin family protein [Streptosporangiaceae bacterium]|nr:pirin family protein [Streptosporangiaceae bacterium]